MCGAMLLRPLVLREAVRVPVRPLIQLQRVCGCLLAKHLMEASAPIKSSSSKRIDQLVTPSSRIDSSIVSEALQQLLDSTLPEETKIQEVPASPHNIIPAIASQPICFLAQASCAEHASCCV